MKLDSHVLELIQKQVAHEDFNNHKYLLLADWCKFHSYDEAAELFISQAEDEITHRDKFKDHLLDRDYMPESYTVVDSMLMPESLEDCVVLALEAEQETTANILAIQEAAEKVEDYTTCSMLKWFIDEQVEEEKMFMNLLTYIDSLGLNESDMPEWAKKQARMSLAAYMGEQVEGDD